MQALTCFKSSSNLVNEILQRNESTCVLPSFDVLTILLPFLRHSFVREEIFTDIVIAFELELQKNNEH